MKIEWQPQDILFSDENASIPTSERPQPQEANSEKTQNQPVKAKDKSQKKSYKQNSLAVHRNLDNTDNSPLTQNTDEYDFRIVKLPNGKMKLAHNKEPQYPQRRAAPITEKIIDVGGLKLKVKQ
ncbi:MAG: hypothetical protein HC846_07155 [Blastocatellia bacterium]|nr:hypothetical protein [Blastocatellia bacterium]